MEPTRINISNFKTKFEVYPDELLAIAKEHDLTLPKITEPRGQGLALMAQPEVAGKLYLTRPECQQFMLQIGMYTPEMDPIQCFNKDTGIKRLVIKGKYVLKYPFVVDLLHKKKRENADLSEDSKSTVIERIKQLHRERMDEPIEKWQIGHLDPTIEDSSPMNLAWQPPIQSKYRDRFKWDRDFIKMWPTANELIPKFGQYYTESERREIYAHLKGVFEPHLCVD